MKTLVESIKEGMLMESREQLILAFSHNNPEFTCIVKINDRKELNLFYDKVGDYDWQVMSPVVNNGGLIFLYHNDETGALKSLRVKNEQQLKRGFINDIAKELKKYEDKEYCEVDIPTVEWYIELDVEDYDVEQLSDIKPELVYDRFIEWVDDTYIDGDSASAYIIYDPVKGERLHGPGMNVKMYTVGEFVEMLEED